MRKVAILLAAALLMAPSPPPGPSNEAPWDRAWTNVVPPNHTGQTFTAISPSVAHVDIDVITANPTHGDRDSLTLTLLGRRGAVLGSVTRTLLRGTDGWQRFTVARPIHVNPREVLTIRVADTNKVLFGWRYTLNTYAGGTSIMIGAADARYDFRFRVNAP